MTLMDSVGYRVTLCGQIKKMTEYIKKLLKRVSIERIFTLR